MRESIFKGFLFILLSVLTAFRCHAAEETADAVLTRAQNVFAASAGVTVQAYQREVWIPMMEMTPGRPNFGPPVNYHILNLRRKNPDDWYVAIWSFSQSRPGSIAVARQPAGVLMTKLGATLGKLSSFGGTRVESSPQNSLTDDEFSQTLHGRLLDPFNGFVAVEPLVDGPAKDATNPLFGLKDARLVGSETWQGHEAYRLEGTGIMGGPAVLWIDRQSGLVLRTVMQRGAGGGMFRTLLETIYTTMLNAKLVSIDFDPQPPPASSDQMSEEQMGFGPSADLKQYAGSAGGMPPGRSMSLQPSVSAPVASSSAPEQQALSAEQMEGIVLIDGDEGTATGFMTQIKGVDFVVTNQHVLGQNKKITLKNLHGEVVPVQAIFGAAGSDIAILKIAKAQGTLKLAEDVLKSVKIGDKIVVVGNRLGGGVATQTSGQVLGVGPTRIEVNANFEPGNSGSPIFSTGTKEVVGVATYAETRKVAVEDGASTTGSASATTKVDKRWFGYRLDGITKWEQINMERWHAQGERIEKFRDMSEALVAVIRFDFKKAAANERLEPLIADFESKVAKLGSNRMGVADEVKSLIYNVRSVAESGVRDFESAEYYDYYRTCLYWEESVQMQVEYRKAIVTVLKKYEANSGTYLSKMRNGGS